MYRGGSQIWCQRGVKLRTGTGSGPDLVNFGVGFRWFSSAQALSEALVGCVGKLTTCSSSLKKNPDEKYFFIMEKKVFEKKIFRKFLKIFFEI